MERLGIRLRDSSRTSRDSGSITLQPRSNVRATLLRVHEYCVADSVSCLCNLLQAPDDAENRVSIALGEAEKTDENAADVVVGLQDTLNCLARIECNLFDISRSLTRSKSNRAWVSDYQPDWRIRNLIWDLVKSLGKINPPEECALAFRQIKEATFAALFKGNYLIEQRKQATFKSTLLRHIPRPNAWDANMSWLAVSNSIYFPWCHGITAHGRLVSTKALLRLVAPSFWFLVRALCSSAIDSF